MTVDLFTKPKNGFACGGTARLKSAKGESEASVSEQIGRLFWRAALKCVGAIRFKLDVTGSFEEASALKFDTRRQISSHDLRVNFISPAMLSTNLSPQVFDLKGFTKKRSSISRKYFAWHLRCLFSPST